MNIQDFTVSPDDEPVKGEADEKDDAEAKPAVHTGKKEPKSFIKKVQDALQEWSNEDQADQEFDDHHP